METKRNQTKPKKQIYSLFSAVPNRVHRAPKQTAGATCPACPVGLHISTNSKGSTVNTFPTMIPVQFGVCNCGGSLGSELSNGNQSLGVGSVVVEGALRVGIILDTWGLKVSMAWQQSYKQNKTRTSSTQLHFGYATWTFMLSSLASTTALQHQAFGGLSVTAHKVVLQYSTSIIPKQADLTHSTPRHRQSHHPILPFQDRYNRHVRRTQDDTSVYPAS